MGVARHVFPGDAWRPGAGPRWLVAPDGAIGAQEGEERRLAWMARFRRLARDYERLPETLAGLHFWAFAMLLLNRVVHWALPSA